MNAVVEALLRSSLQGALFIAAVWLVCRLLPRLPAAVRCGLWWAASLKLLVGLVWISPVELPLLPAAADPNGVFNRTVSGAAGALTSPALLSQGERREKSGMQNVVVFSPSLPLGERGQGSEGSKRASRIKLSRTAVVGFLLLAWLTGLALQAAKALRQLRHTRWVVARSRPLHDGWIRAAFAELCALLALRRPPELRGSEDVRTPQAIGPLRPLVLLPESGLARLSPAEMSMTLCHELVHLRRGDLWLGWVPALAHRIFFFHPLAALAAREYAIAREAACDAEVLRHLGSAPQAYGRLLLRWGVAPRETGLAAAGASPSLENLKRRLQMLQQTSELISKSERRLSGWWWLAGAAVMVGLIPLRIVAQEPAPEAQPDAAPVVAAAPAPPAVAAEPAEAPAAVADGIPGGVEGGVAGGVEGGIPGGVVSGVKGGVVGGVKGGVVGGVAGALAPGASLPKPGAAPVAVALPSAGPRPALAPVGRGPVGAPPAVAAAPVALPAPGAAARPVVAPVATVAALPGGTPRAAQPAPPAPPAPPVPPAPPRKHGYSYSWHQTDDGDSWVMLTGESSANMSGSMGDLEKAKRLRGKSGEDILWFRHDGKEYVVRDAAVMKRAKEIFRPQMELGAKQGELGARQGALGAKQGALGARQGALGGKQGALGAQIAALSAEQSRSVKDDSQLEKRQRDLDAQQEDLSRQQEELGRQQEELGRQQEALGRQQEELGRQQEAASAKAEKELHALMEQAVRSGSAQEVK